MAAFGARTLLRLASTSSRASITSLRSAATYPTTSMTLGCSLLSVSRSSSSLPASFWHSGVRSFSSTPRGLSEKDDDGKPKDDTEVSEKEKEKEKTPKAPSGADDFIEKLAKKLEVKTPAPQEETTTVKAGDNREVYETKQQQIVVGLSGGNAGTSLLTISKHIVPKSVPIIPLYRRPVFPGVVSPLAIYDPVVSRELLRRREQGFEYVGLFLVRNHNDSVASATEPVATGQPTTTTTATTTTQGSNSTTQQVIIEPNAAGNKKKNSFKKQYVSEPYEIYDVGVLARIDKHIPTIAGTSTVITTVLTRVRLSPTGELIPETDASGKIVEIPASQPETALRTTNKLKEFNIEPLRDLPYDKDDADIRAKSLEVIHCIKETVKLNPFFKEQLETFLDLVDFTNAVELADVAASLTTSDGLALQEILEETDVTKRLYKALVLLRKEHDLNLLQLKINRQIEEEVMQNQRRYFLKEQIKTINKELGVDTDDRQSLLQKFRQRMEALKPSAEVKSVFDDEMAKLQNLEPASSEYGVSRNYLEWITQIPWGVMTQDKLEIDAAQAILDEDHFGLREIKDRILEFIAVGKLRGTLQGKILCLVGPPGVGKTSIGKSIARAIGREFFRFSVGGLRDSAEIKGHRRTYIGAMPGKFVQGMKRAKAYNPLILIDEIDKIGQASAQGDPASALLEVLDPEQNKNFLDHYLDVPMDLSNVLFVCTANVTDTIPGPLLDRMEVLRLSGYVLEEKLKIMSQYLIPNTREETGLTVQQCSITDGAAKELIQKYCRESGVRNLQKQVEKIFRKAALKRVRGDESNMVVSTSNLEEFIGKPVFSDDKVYDHVTPPGVVTGLAWTSMGGATLYIESTTIPTDGSPTLLTTGQMGDVMEESTKIALTYARHKLPKLFPGNRVLESSSIHIHIPEGATPKDGPSAGVTLVTALLSLATEKPVRPRLAMTGEITLNGKVLAIGGVKEKVIAAKRTGIKHLCFPKANRYDFEKLDDYIRKGLEVYYADTYDDVYTVAFGTDEQLQELKARQADPNASSSSSSSSAIPAPKGKGKGKGKAKAATPKKGGKKTVTKKAKEETKEETEVKEEVETETEIETETESK